MSGTAVEILSDNSTTVSYINKQGGTHSLSLFKLAQDLWDCCDLHQITPTALHLAGVDNVLADALSRGNYCPMEWSLHRQTLMSLWQVWDRPIVDMFAMARNSQLPVYYSLGVDPQGSGTNALNMNWDLIFGYAYPRLLWSPGYWGNYSTDSNYRPFCPMLASQIWFRQLTNLLVDVPGRLPDRSNLLRNLETHELYLEPARLRLTLWKLSADQSLHRLCLQRTS